MRAKKGERVIMKITGSLVELMIEIDPHKYKKFVVFEKGRPVLYVEVNKAIYGEITAAMEF